MVSLSAAVHITGFCAYEFAAKAQNNSVAKMERFLILEVFAGSMLYPSKFARGGLRRYQVPVITRECRLGLVVKALQPRANRATTSEGTASRSAAPRFLSADTGARQDSPASHPEHGS